MLRTRALSAVVLLLPVAALLWLGDVPWLVGVVLAALLAVRELFAALQQKSYHPIIAAGVFAAIALPAAAYYDGTLVWLLPAIVITITVPLVAVLGRQTLDGALADWAVTISGTLYVALLASYFVALRQQTDGLRWILMAFLCTWACDSAAYLVGSAIGRRPFSPRISPKKTWEGTLGGVAAATLTGLLAVPLLGLSIPVSLLLGVSVAIAAIAGDLVESFIKRQLGIKDSGTLIPGHGGVLDRIDSLLFAVPLVYYLALWLGGL